MTSQFNWMRETVYEPTPLPRSTYAHARRRAMTARIFAVLAALAIISGALVALNQLRG